MPAFRFCELCKRYFEEELEVHQLKCTKSVAVENQQIGDTEQPSAGCTREVFDCEFCSNRFPNDEELNAHQKKCKHEEIEYERCSSLIEACKMTEQTEKHSLKTITKCLFCDTEMGEEKLKAHIVICDLVPVRCEKCQVLIPRRYMTHHLSVECIKRTLECEYCKDALVADILQEHFLVCGFIPVYCENKCGQEMKRSELEEHLVKECPKRIVECKYCAENFEAELLENHYSECERYPVACPKVCGKSIQRNAVEKHLNEECEKSHAKCVYHVVSCRFEGFPVDLHKHMQEETIFHAKIATEKIRKQDDVIDLLEKRVKKTEEFEKKLEVFEKKISEVEVKLKEMPEFEGPITYCRFLWKIKNIPGNLESFPFHTELSSNTFYDSKYGYKLQVICHPNGRDYNDGEIVKNFVGIFIYICSGEYDSVLQWPFQKRVTFTLIDQKDRSNDIVRQIKGFEHESFQKPKNGKRNNLAYGFRQFVSRDKVRIGNYVWDNVLFIEIKVDDA